MFTLTLFELVSLIVGCAMAGGVVGVCIMCIIIGGSSDHDKEQPNGQEH
jgi:hypothetical protein